MKAPAKPRADFPLFAAGNGQWAKKVNQRKYYFGSWKDDPKGEAALKDWLARKDSIHAGLDKLRVEAAAEGMTVGQLKARFLDSRRTMLAASELSQRTLTDYVIELEHFENKVGSDAQIVAMKPEHFAKYAKLLITERKLGRHARKRVIAYVKAMFNWGAGNGLFPTPHYGTEFKAPDTRPEAIRQAKAREGKQDFSERLISGQELDNLLSHCHVQMKAIILLGINCGLGPADIGRLRWAHVNLASGLLDMPRGKTGAERVGYLWKRTRHYLNRVRQMKANRVAYEKDGDKALVFTTRNSLPLYHESEDGHKNNISTAVNRIVRKAGLKGITHYRLRHAFKTVGKKGRDADALNLMMGHKERTTGKTYDHEKISFRRIKRVSITIKKRLWPRPKVAKPQPLRIAG